MRRSFAILVVLGGVFLLAQCGGEEALMLELMEQNGSGQSGTATLTTVGDGRTRIVLELANAGQVAQPAHVHPGACDDLGPPVAGLESLVDGRSATIVPLSLSELQAGGLVVHAHKSDAEFEISVACAPIPEG